MHVPHKYLHVTEFGHDGKRGKTEKLEIGYALFNLDKDISEQQNVKSEHPGISEKLKMQIQKFKKEIDSTARPPFIKEH